MHRKLVLAPIFVALIALMAGPAFADTSVPPDFNLFICQSCSVAPSAPTVLTDLSSFNVGDAGNHATQSPVFIIVGTYNGAPAPTLSFGSNNSITPGAPAGLYGYNGLQGFALTSGNPYDALGINPDGGGASQSFDQWNSIQGEVGNGPASVYDLFVYEIPGAVLPAMGTISLDMTGGTVGDIVIGYSCEDVTTGLCPGGAEGATPFTTTGIVGTPEPATLSLLAFGMAGLGLARRRRRS